MNVHSPPYLTSSRPCSECKRFGRATECRHRLQDGMKNTQIPTNNYSSAQEIQNPSRISDEPLLDTSFKQTRPTVTVQHIPSQTPLRRFSISRTGNGTFGSQKPSVIIDLDFPSLACSSLDNCLLNSPLEITPDFPLHSELSVPALGQSFNHKNLKSVSRKDSHSAAKANNKFKTIPFPQNVNSSQSSNLEGMSHYDEATWNDQFGYSFTFNNGSQPTWNEGFSCM
jgi:hypothetical protein